MISKLNQIGEEGHKLNELFKQELLKGLNIKVGRKSVQIDNPQQPGTKTTIVVSDTVVLIEPASKKLSLQVRSVSA